MGVSMKIGVVLAALAALAVSGCNAECGGAATNSTAAGACGLHTTFFASKTASQPAAAFRKS
jgi:hypothetical protein